MQLLQKSEPGELYDLPDIEELIKNRSFIPYFQPVISVSRKTICGFEGLIRGIDLETNEIISPLRLFDAAGHKGVTVELDRVCREIVMEAYCQAYGNHKDKLLFLNIDASIIDKVGGSSYLLNQVKNCMMNPQNIVLEVNETKVKDSNTLKKFVDTYREKGFLIALDDVGTGFSNMDRIFLLKPDIIKLDMSLIRNIHSDFYKQEVFNSLVHLSNKIGALIIAEGVELAEEAIEILKFGGHMIQGYYFSKPKPICEGPDVFNKSLLEAMSGRFKKYMNHKMKESRKRNRQLKAAFNNVLKEISVLSSHEFDGKLTECISDFKRIECTYILDEQGIQHSNTICCTDRKKVENLIFYSAEKGTDHSMKNYYFNLINGRLNKYITEPYISLATGNLCITFSKFFRNAENKKYILCLDFEACMD